MLHVSTTSTLLKPHVVRPVENALTSPGLKTSLAKVGVSPQGTSPDEGARFVRAEYKKWKQTIVDGNIKEK